MYPYIYQNNMSRDNIKQDRGWFALDLPILYWDF